MLLNFLEFCLKMTVFPSKNIMLISNVLLFITMMTMATVDGTFDYFYELDSLAHARKNTPKIFTFSYDGPTGKKSIPETNSLVEFSLAENGATRPSYGKRSAPIENDQKPYLWILDYNWLHPGEDTNRDEDKSSTNVNIVLRPTEE